MAKLTVDTDLVSALADLMEEKGLTEVEVSSGDQALRLSKASAAAPAVIAGPAPVAMAGPAAADAGPASAAGADHQGAVNSPMVGTVYLSPQPGAPAFVKVGDQIAEGQTLLIIEAMKVMNPIPAPRSGKVTSVLVSDGDPVEFDQALVILE